MTTRQAKARSAARRYAKYFRMTPELMYFGDALRAFLGLDPLWILEK